MGCLIAKGGQYAIGIGGGNKTNGSNITINGGIVIANGGEQGGDIYLAHTFTLTANQDPDSTDNYYATFFTRECAYKLPEDGSVKAYIGTVEKYGGANVLNLTKTDIIHARAMATV